MGRGILVALVLLGVACASPVAQPPPERAPDFRALQVRQPTVVLRVSFDRSAFGDQDRTTLPSTLEGLLLQGLNARTVPPRDVQLLGEGSIDPPAALRRARELDADHLLLVDVRIEQGSVTFCRGEGRPFTATVRRVRQGARLIRTRDGVTRVTLSQDRGPSVTDLRADCSNPRASKRRTTQALLAEAVERLLDEVLRP